MAAASLARSSVKRISYYLVLDFEATCDDHRKLHPSEIIEFPVLKVNAVTKETEDVFHTYVRPTHNPNLTPFCTSLTGITQAQVDDQPTLPEVLDTFHKWLESNKLLNPSENFCFVTCGDWDLKTMLPSQCRYFGWRVPEYFKSWMNIKFVFKRLTGVPAKGMPHMLNHFGLTLDGRHHSGIDDTKNIKKILTKLLDIEPNIQPTTV